MEVSLSFKLKVRLMILNWLWIKLRMNLCFSEGTKTLLLPVIDFRSPKTISEVNCFDYFALTGMRWISTTAGASFFVRWGKWWWWGDKISAPSICIGVKYPWLLREASFLGLPRNDNAGCNTRPATKILVWCWIAPAGRWWSLLEKSLRGGTTKQSADELLNKYNCHCEEERRINLFINS